MFVSLSDHPHNPFHPPPGTGSLTEAGVAEAAAKRCDQAVDEMDRWLHDARGLTQACAFGDNEDGNAAALRFAQAGQEYLAAVRPMGKALALSTMLYADEVVSQDELEGLPGSEAKPRELTSRIQRSRS